MINSNEADLVIEGDDIIKLYRPHVKLNKQIAEFVFLNQFQHTHYVPRLYSTLDDVIQHHFIRMQYMAGYDTLTKTLKIIKSYPTDTQQWIKTMVVDELIAARQAIGKDIYYTDLHMNNVLVDLNNGAFAPALGVNTMHVVFIDPGRSETYSEASKEWLINVAKHMNVVKMMRNRLNVLNNT